MLLFQQLIVTQLSGNYNFLRYPRNLCCQGLSSYLRFTHSFPKVSINIVSCVNLLCSFCHCDSTVNFNAAFSCAYSRPCPLIKIQVCEAPNFVIHHTSMFPLC